MKIKEYFKYTSKAYIQTLSINMRDKLIANLKIMLDTYVDRNIIQKNSYSIDYDDNEDYVYINYVLNNYDELKNVMTQDKYDSYREKLNFYCIRTAEMLTMSASSSCVIYEEFMMMGCGNPIPEIKKHMTIY